MSTNGIEIQWQSNAVAAYWDVLNRNALGNFRQLLEDVTLNPAMGVYLSTLDNRKEDTRTGRVPDENYAREVMQLFTIGLNELNNDGTKKSEPLASLSKHIPIPMYPTLRVYLPVIVTTMRTWSERLLSVFHHNRSHR